MFDESAGQDVAAHAQELSAGILAKLDELTAGPQTPESAPKLEKLTMQEQLDALEPLLDAAVESRNEAKVRRLIQAGKEIIRTEKMAREHELEEAQDYFNEALKTYGETGEETMRSAQEVANWKKSLQDFDAYIVEQDRYYDDVLANMNPPVSSPAPRPEAKPEVEKRAETLEERMEVVKRLKAAYEAKLAEIQAEEKSVAGRLVEERVAKLKQDIGA